MEQNLQWCPTFNNLTTLTLGGWCRYKDFDPLIVFLWNSPNLEQLTLELSKNMMFNLDQRFTGIREERSFTCQHLVMVNIVFIIFGSDSKGSKGSYAKWPAGTFA
ncbi:hypothetical protein SEVIR_9G305566v4 [Setaria viridis]|uniref:FBD domain-containing protein n=1 Tax=Setaria viridis TaxID=4556 RepID=A0A4U6SZE9_SETVI|nr:hypothetical protein SEVIR_9G305566v2 [Setaria viridis]